MKKEDNSTKVAFIKWQKYSFRKIQAQLRSVSIFMNWAFPTRCKLSLQCTNRLAMHIFISYTLWKSFLLKILSGVLWLYCNTLRMVGNSAIYHGKAMQITCVGSKLILFRLVSTKISWISLLEVWFLRLYFCVIVKIFVPSNKIGHS